VNLNFDPEDIKGIDDDSRQSIQVTKQVTHNLVANQSFPLSLFSDCLCIAQSESCERQNSVAEKAQYTSLTHYPDEDKVFEVVSEKPIWNTEIQQWTHFFGGRVKVPNSRNFLATTAPSARQLYQINAEDWRMDRMCIRHGMVSIDFIIQLLSHCCCDRFQPIDIAWTLDILFLLSLHLR
jgi:hypothetical protein